MSKVNPAPGYRDGHVDNAKFMFPRGIAFDNVGDLYIADCPADPTEHGHRIRKLSANGEVTTVTGGNIGNRDGRLSVALFNMPSSLTFDSENNLFVVETLGNRIRRITPKGEVTTIAGRAKTVDKEKWTVDGVKFKFHTSIGPNDAATEPSDPGWPFGSALDGLGQVARFGFPRGIAAAPDGCLYVADQFNFQIRKLAPI
mmetsp:Transcript_6277/g.15139  ORF Transcript_6277/g.15139 Transcript_6277/m.15139 type:complete len:200 (+) Transcript_6277:1278-1877(+)